MSQDTGPVNTAPVIQAPTDRRRGVHLAISAAITLAVVVNLLAPVLAWQWARRPFLGLLLEQTLVISDVHNPAWPARQLGLRNADRLLAIDGQPVATGREVAAVLAQKQSGQMVTLTVEKDPARSSAGILTVQVPLIAFPPGDFLMTFWFPYLLGLLYLGMGVAVYRLRRNERSAQVFALFTILFSIFTGSFFDVYSYHWLVYFWTLSIPLAGAALLHLAMVFPAETRLIRRYPWLRFIPYGLALLIGLYASATLYTTPRGYFIPWRWCFAFAGFSALGFIALLLHSRFQTVFPIVRQQARIILWGSIAAFFPVVTWTLTNLLGAQIPLSSAIFILIFVPFAIFPASIAYAVLRYHLLNLDLVISRSLVYLGLTLLVTAAYFLAVSLVGRLFQTSAAADNPVLLALFVLTLIFSLGPVRDRLQGFVDRAFLCEAADYRLLLQNYGHELTSAPLKTERILAMLLNRCETALHPGRTLVFLRDSTGSYTVHAQAGTPLPPDIHIHFDTNDELPRRLAGRPERSEGDEALHLSFHGDAIIAPGFPPEEAGRLTVLDVELFVPLRGTEHLIGWVALGPRRSGIPYHQSDVVFLTTLANQTAIALENAQLLETAEHRARELMALQQTSLDIGAQLETDRLLQAIVERAIHLLGAQGGAMYLRESGGDQLKVVVSYNLDKDYTGTTIRQGEGVAGQVALTGEPVSVDNYCDFPQRATPYRDSQLGAVVGVPLTWGGEVRGVLDVVHRLGGPTFTEDDVWLLSLFASQAAIALENARLFQHFQDRARQLATLNQVSRTINETLDLEAVLQLIMEKAMELLDAEAGSLLLVDGSGQALTFEVVLGPASSQLRGAQMAVGSGIAGMAAKEMRSLIVNDVQSDPRWNVSFDRTTEFVTRNLICVPMISHDRLVGVIEVLNKYAPEGFSEEDIELLSSFAAQAAIAIENARLFTMTDQALGERMQELQTMQIIDQQLNATLDFARVTDLTLGHATDAVGASTGVMGVMDEESTGLYLMAQTGAPAEYARYRDELWPVDRGIIGQVARTGQPAMSGKVKQEPGFDPVMARTQSQMVVPVLYQGRVRAVISLESLHPNAFNQDDLVFVTRLADHAAIAIENARLYQQAQAANQAKTEFMSIASHELKIPMTSIKGYAKLLTLGAGGELNERQRDFLNIISANVDRMDRLVGDLLDVSRIEAGRLRLEMGPVDLRAVIETVVKSVETQIEAKKLSLRVEIPETLPPVWGDHGRLIQVVTNLVSNAYKYTPDGGRIRIVADGLGASSSSDRLTVSVSDTGLGISPEDQQKIFTKFFRADDPYVRDVPGTGLGLSITKSLIEMHGGEIWFRSEPGKGTTFTFTLPVAQGE